MYTTYERKWIGLEALGGVKRLRGRIQPRYKSNRLADTLKWLLRGAVGPAALLNHGPACEHFPVSAALGTKRSLKSTLFRRTFEAVLIYFLAVFTVKTDIA